MKDGPGDRGDFHDGRQLFHRGQDRTSVSGVSGHDAGDGRKACHAVFALVKKPMEMMPTTTAATPSAE